jgi:hypothetical protein
MIHRSTSFEMLPAEQVMSGKKSGAKSLEIEAGCEAMKWWKAGTELEPFTGRNPEHFARGPESWWS